jgi:hypothetical protein
MTTKDPGNEPQQPLTPNHDLMRYVFGEVDPSDSAVADIAEDVPGSDFP